MERSFQSWLLTGKYGVGDGNFLPSANSDDTYNREMCSQTRSHEKSVLTLLNYPYGSSFDHISDGDLQSVKRCEISNECSRFWSFEREENVKRLKSEPSSESLFINLSPTIVFNQLPELRSMELLNEEERRLRQKFSPVTTTTYNQHMLESPLANFQLTTNHFTPAPPQVLRPPFPAPVKLSSREQAYRKRQTVSDKTRSLQMLLPVDKKMDTATTYEEAFKYITFLKAQITALESMPVSSPFSTSNFRSENPRYGGLGKLNRQQLLEVLVNSPAAQSTLYSKGCCIYSLEQLMLFKDIAEKSFFFSNH